MAERLVALGYRVEDFSEREAAAERSAELFATGELRATIAAGGDGTVADLVNRLPIGAPVGILPLGTENLVARYLGLRRLDDVVAAVQSGRPFRCDAGSANGRLFLLMAGAGFDAEVIRQLAVRRRGNISHLNYVMPLLTSIRDYAYPPIRVYCDESLADPPTNAVAHPPRVVRWAQVINVPLYAFGLRFVPEADPTDGVGDLCAFPRGGFWNTLGYYLGVRFGRQRSWTDMAFGRSRRFRFEADVPTPYQLDGDPAGFLPVTIEMLPNRVTLLPPPHWQPRYPPRS